MIIIKATNIFVQTHKFCSPRMSHVCDAKPSHVICTEDVRVAFKFLSLYFQVFSKGTSQCRIGVRLQLCLVSGHLGEGLLQLLGDGLVLLLLRHQLVLQSVNLDTKYQIVNFRFFHTNVSE